MSLVRWVWCCTGVGLLAGPTILGVGTTGGGWVLPVVVVPYALMLGYAGSLLVEGDDAPLGAMFGPLFACVIGSISFLVSLLCLAAFSQAL